MVIELTCSEQASRVLGIEISRSPDLTARRVSGRTSDWWVLEEWSMVRTTVVDGT
jgi:hypothetical protein